MGIPAAAASTTRKSLHGEHICVTSDTSVNETTHVVPIYEGYSLPHCTLQSEVGGRALTDYMQRLLQESGIDLAALPGGQREDTAIHGFVSPIARDIQRTLCYVNVDHDLNDLDAVDSTSFVLADESTIRVHSERVRCPELLFNPRLHGYDCENMKKT